ncbi:glycosyltransferase involved in cell wall biosynthesis [Fusobacterium sp. PH5-7]|uniref:glycosyltransferase n=1 Tax=Fusobacterium sp. PH5-7 TaxID=2940528 RepID=UPI00247619D7|nr:glycosyltransferase [Fusobacterium sp. PH5-7]MDH6456559.1 glycosyltransferase involved in cell wall biosynthesis [Fusobacterium sp. PH5-7]
MKKKVIFRSGSLRMGGLERVLIEVLQTIDKEKFDIYLVIDDDCGKENIFEKDIPKNIPYFFLKPEKLIRETEKYKEKKKNIIYKLMYNLMMEKENKVMYRNMQRILKDIGEIDVIVDFDAGASKYIEKLDIKKKIVWIHNSIPNLKKKESKIKRFGKRLEKYDRVVAICDEMKEEIENIYPNLKGKVSRIYNPFNFERIEKLMEDERELTKEQKKMLNEDYCIAIARLDNVQKDFLTLVRAYKFVKESGIQDKLYIIGDGPSKEEIINEIKKLSLEENIKLIGLSKNPYIWLKNSKLFVHSSKYEGLPTVLIEALICNKMIISSNCPTGPKEILKNENCGKLFEVGNIKELGDYLIEFLTNKNNRELYEKNVILRKEEFNKNKVIKEYEKLIEEI